MYSRFRAFEAAFFLAVALAFSVSSTHAQEIEYLGKPARNVPISAVVKAGKFVFVSGTPGYKDGKLAIGDFGAQMKQAMENIAAALNSAGADWSRVVKVTVMLVHAQDVDEMNRIYASYFDGGKYPARSTVILAGLATPDYLVEIEAEAITE
jgi:2-iminobutanoate/2-iminopropanoate deaminase